VSAASKRSAELAARMKAVTAATTAPAAAVDQAAARPPADPQIRRSAPADHAAAAAPRTRPVRMTVEMAPVEHRRLRRLCQRYAEDLDLPDVASAEVVRVLVELAATDDDLAARVGHVLRRTGGNRRR